jgi:SAM-dependent methyltransferase
MFRARVIGSIRWLGLTGAVYRLYQAIQRFDPISVRRNRRFAGPLAPDGLPIPPGHLITLVAGTPDIEWFLEYGRATDHATRAFLRRNGLDIARCSAMLDFGCGCGRIVRHWRDLPDTRLAGTDYNPRLITWCRENLPFARFDSNGLEPPLTYSGESFDLITAYSVFTHLTRDLQQRWIDELARVLKPGGYLLVTTQGSTYAHLLTAGERARFQGGELIVRYEEVAGTNLCAAFHPRPYLEREFGRGLAVIDHIPAGQEVASAMLQDVTLLQKSRQ